MWHNILNSITKDWITFLASMGTLMAALAAMRTIAVMKRQMHSAYKPEIFVSADNTNRIVVLPIDIEKRVDRKIVCFYGAGDFQEKHGLRIILHNVGAGAAKNIKINWRFDYELAVRKIEEALIGTSYGLKYGSDKKSISIRNSSADFL